MDQQKVVVTDIDMKFGTMVWFLVKLAIASIPAALILLIFGVILALIVGGVVRPLTGI